MLQARDILTKNDNLCRWGLRDGIRLDRGEQRVWKEYLKASDPEVLPAGNMLKQHQVPIDQGYGTHALQGFGSRVWIVGMDRMWARGE